MGAWADLIKAVAALLWPILAFVILWVFKPQIRDLLKQLGRIKKGKLLGQEIELDRELDVLKESAEKAQEAIAAIPQPSQSVQTVVLSRIFEDEILRDVAKSPKATLILLGVEIEKRLRELLAATGWHENISARPVSQAIERLRAQGSLPDHVSGSVKLFQDVRNKIVHGRQATDEDILRAIDSGFTLLKAIDSVPATMHVVREPGVTIYSDPECRSPITDAKGVILDAVSPGGADKSLGIYPTTRTHFKKGMRVAWEWNLDKVWGKAWYKDPDTGDTKQAWHEAGEFIGRDLDEV